ncbi:MAG: hypothetical protein KGL44_03715 [Sphingomonadales bacterium]|nr:hypothetical protein [Sphingomonadales bacterium]
MSATAPVPGEAEALLPRLSPAQYRAVRDGKLVYGPGYWPLKHALWARGLFTTANRYDVLTRLGEEVQALIRKGRP